MIGQYYACLVGCDLAGKGESSDGVPEHVDPERTLPICPFYTCGSGEIDRWPLEFRDPDTGLDLWTCRGCGQDFHA